MVHKLGSAQAFAPNVSFEQGPGFSASVDGQVFTGQNVFGTITILKGHVHFCTLLASLMSAFNVCLWMALEF